MLVILSTFLSLMNKPRFMLLFIAFGEKKQRFLYLPSTVFSMRLLNEVLGKISPSRQEKKMVSEASSEFLKKISKGLKGAKAVLGGSAAKGTWLSGTFDIDVFVCFDYKAFKDKSSKLSDLLRRHLKKKFKKVAVMHGSRDYFKVKQGKFNFEVIPVLEISKAKQAMNIMDISPLHLAWVKRRINKKLADEVRLTKAFCRAQNIYGAESYILGFSGYACEVLTIHYGTFLKLVRAATKWKDKQVIDPERHLRRKCALKELNKSKIQGPLILVDPVQPNRNVTAALSKEKFGRFVKSAKTFLRRPSKKFFERSIISIEGLRKRAKGKRLIIIEAKPVKGKEDIIGAKLLKALEFVNKELATNDFKVYSYGWSWEKKSKAIYWFILDKKSLNKKIIVSGPPLRKKEHACRFRKKHKKIFIRNRRIYAVENRLFVKPEKLIARLIKKPYFRTKVKKAKCLCFT
jgi:tRNA nucleotidyltransferase (CCA-adding enzyme)